MWCGGNNHTITRFSIQTAGLAFGGTGLCSYRVRVVGAVVQIPNYHWRPHIGEMGSADPPWKMDEKIKKRKHAKRSSFLCSCDILTAIMAGRCRERRYADHIFIQIYFRMHHFVVKFSKFSSPQATRGHWPLTKILRTFLLGTVL